jgi:hypothetical protein
MAHLNRTMAFSLVKVDAKKEKVLFQKKREAHPTFPGNNKRIHPNMGFLKVHKWIKQSIL